MFVPSASLRQSQFVKRAVIVGFVAKLLPYIKRVKHGDFGNLVECVGVSFSYIYLGGCFGHKSVFVVFLGFLVKYLVEFIYFSHWRDCSAFLKNLYIGFKY